MAVDSSIYQNALPIQQPNIADSMTKAMSLSQMAMQNQQAQLVMQNQQAMRDAYAKNTDPTTGQVNQQGFISDVSKASPQMGMEYQEKFNKMNKDSADAHAAQLDSATKQMSVVMPAVQYLAGLNEDDKAKAFPQIASQLAQKGVDVDSYFPKDADGNHMYDKNQFGQVYGQLKQTDAYLAKLSKQAEIQKTYSDIGQAPAKMNSELYGSRSPNAELTSQYDKQAQPIRQSQVAMQQMYDNYNHPSPQGDASLILNAFKIKFPNAPDVNSLEELTKSQSAPDMWKQSATHALSGGLDQGTRDNLMRDAASTFRANVDSLSGIKDRYKARAKVQNVNDQTLTAEPAIDKTYGDVMKLQDKIGPYVPPSDRGGTMAKISGMASSLLGLNGNKSNKDDSGNSVLPSANASSKGSPPPNAPPDSVLMKSPSGKLKWVSKSNYAEAIAAGGSVVK